MKKNLSKLLLVCFVPALLFSCKKESIQKTSPIKFNQTEQKAVMKFITNSTLMQLKYIGMLDASEIHRIAIEDGFGGKNCMTTIADDGNGNRTLDFGSNCLGDDGKVYGGRAIVQMIGEKIKNQGFTMNVEYQNFQMEESIFNGTVSVENMGKNGDGNLYFKAVSDLTTTFEREKYKFNGHNEFFVEIINPDSTVAGDEIYKVTGGGIGKTQDNLNFSNTILSALEYLRADGCEHITKGVLKIETETLPDKEIDFGSGVCDDEVIVTENGSNPRVEYLD